MRAPDGRSKDSTRRPRSKEAWGKPLEEAKKRLFERFVEHVRKERFSWLERSRVHSATSEQVVSDEEVAQVLPECRAVEIGTTHTEQARERAHKLGELLKSLGLVGERLALFKQLVVAYRREPTIENYVRVRRECPDVEVQVARFGGLDMLFALEQRFREHGIDPNLIAGTLDADEPSIDALSLRLMECLIARSKLPKDGPGHIAKRREAISDTLVNYLIAGMLEALDDNDAIVRIPRSLIVLIRQQLCGSNPDLHNEYVLREARQKAAIVAGHHFHQINETLSIRKLAELLSVSRNMASRWLKDKEFLYWFDVGKRFAAGTLDRCPPQRPPAT
jgi:hypothetical protein